MVQLIKLWLQWDNHTSVSEDTITQKLQQGDYHGLPTRIFGNRHLRLEVLAGAGPRIVRLFLAGSGENLLAEVPDIQWETPYGDFHLWGGHRLWHAPEAFPRTSVPDDRGLVIKQTKKGILLCQPTEVATGIRKSIEIHLHDDHPALTLRHSLQNDGLWPVELAPWAITQLPPGGIVVMPQVAAKPDGGLLPNRRLVLWPYARWDDPRFHLYDDYVLVDAQAGLPPYKIGCFNPRGWAGYVRQDVLLCKRFTARPEQPYPDLGCNVEVYCAERFVELETLGPLCQLEPGKSVAHSETWEFYPVPEAVQTIGAVRTTVGKLKL